MENTLQPLKIESLIHEIRGHKVMLDRDLAKLYGVETKVLNQAVKRRVYCLEVTNCDFKLGWNKKTAICFYRTRLSNVIRIIEQRYCH